MCRCEKEGKKKKFLIQSDIKVHELPYITDELLERRVLPYCLIIPNSLWLHLLLLLNWSVNDLRHFLEYLIFIRGLNKSTLIFFGFKYESYLLRSFSRSIFTSLLTTLFFSVYLLRYYISFFFFQFLAHIFFLLLTLYTFFFFRFRYM